MLTNGLSPVHLLILLVLVVLLVGGKRLPAAARGIGQSLRIFKAEMGAKDEHESPPATTSGPPTAPAATQQPLADGQAPTVAPQPDTQQRKPQV